MTGRAGDKADPGRLGMHLFLLSLTVLFAASIAGYLAVRFRADAWPPPGTPPLPAGLWIATIVLLASSGSIAVALSGVRNGRGGALRGGLAATAFLGVLFFLLQIRNWTILSAEEVTAESNLYGFTFYMLTGLHAVHLLGGLAALTVVTARAFRGAYTASLHGGVHYMSMYWHFLDAVWIVLFAVLAIGQHT